MENSFTVGEEISSLSTWSSSAGIQKDSRVLGVKRETQKSIVSKISVL